MLRKIPNKILRLHVFTIFSFQSCVLPAAISFLPAAISRGENVYTFRIARVASTSSPYSGPGIALSAKSAFSHPSPGSKVAGNEEKAMGKACRSTGASSDISTRRYVCPWTMFRHSGTKLLSFSTRRPEKSRNSLAKAILISSHKTLIVQ